MWNLENIVLYFLMETSCFDEVTHYQVWARLDPQLQVHRISIMEWTIPSCRNEGIYVVPCTETDLFFLRRAISITDLTYKDLLISCVLPLFFPFLFCYKIFKNQF